MGAAGRGRAGPLREAVPGRVPVGPLVADDPAQAGGVPGRVRRLRPGPGGDVRRRGRRAAARGRGDRAAPRQDRGRDRERARRARPACDREAVARARVVVPGRRAGAALVPRLAGDDSGVGGTVQGAAEGGFPLRRADDGLLDDAGLRRRERPPRNVPRPRRDGASAAGRVALMQIEVGQRAQRTRVVQARDIELFTELTGDRNPLHYDEARAEASRFGGLIVQGGVTSGLLNAVVAEDLPGPGSVFLHVDWDFRAPVRPGDEITAEVEVLEVREDKPIETLRTTITNQDGTVVLDGEALVWTEPV